MLVETEKKLEGETSYYAGSEAELAKMHCDFRSEIEYFQEEESRVRKTTRTEIETAIRRELRKRTENPNEIPWLVATGAESASKKVLNVINLLESALHGDDNTLVKTMRVARNAILHIQEGVQYREGACMMQCSCTGEGRKHYAWPSYTAGCHTETSFNQTRIGGRLWDIGELLRLHHGYDNPRPVAQSTIYALKQLADELQSKEDALGREVAKIAKEPNESLAGPF